ncbi:MAG TPA: AEC family transporter [Paracoccaceae bacterium]|nr:AEC family transporter [Paracoccaceae bacterium]
MFDVLALTAPIYLLIATGFLAARSRYVAADDVRAVGRVVMRLCMPAAIFVAVSGADVTEVLRWNFVLGYTGGSLVVFGAGLIVARRVLGQSQQGAALLAMGMSCSNSAFMGFPVAAMAVGDAALQAFTMAMLIENILMMPLAVTLAEARPGQGLRALGQTALGMVRNPLLIAVMAGVAFSLSGLAMPGFVAATLAMLAPVAPPLALLAVGGIVATLPPARGVGVVPWVVAGKLVAHPLAVLGGLTLAGPMPAPLLLSGVLIAAVPMMSIYALFGQRWGQEQVAASSLLTATVLSFVTVSAAIALI